MGHDVKIRDIAAASGTKESGYLQVLDLFGYGLKLPLMIVNGAKEGPTLMITAGIHGCEYAGIETAMRLFARLDPQEISGTVLLVPIANVPGFLGRQAFVNPIDQLDIDALYDGEDPNPHAPKRARVFGIHTATMIYPYGIRGSVSQVLADALFKEVVSKSDYLIDFHGGDFPEEIVDFAIVNKTDKKEVDVVSESLGRCFSTKYIVNRKAVPTGGGLVGMANRAGIPGVAPQVGHSGKLEKESVELLFNGTLNVMKYLKMINGSPNLGEPTIITAQHTVKTDRAGIYRPAKRVGEIVQRGEMVGVVRDLFGEVVQELKAPAPGLLLVHQYNPSVLPGDTTWVIGEL